MTPGWGCPLPEDRSLAPFSSSTTATDLELLRAVCAATDRPVVASGGVSTLADIEAIRSLVGEGVEGAIIGSALYKGAFTLPEALTVAGRP